MANSEQTAGILNQVIKVTIRPSKTHGVGVFAIQDIPKGVRLHMDDLPQVYYLPYSSFGKLFPEVRDNIVNKWPRVVNNEKFAFPEARFQAYCNHSDDPNYDSKTDSSLRDISVGEEIFEDYRVILGYEKAYPWLDKKKVKDDNKKK